MFIIKQTNAWLKFFTISADILEVVKSTQISGKRTKFTEKNCR